MQSGTLLDMSKTLASVYVNCECWQKYETEMGPCRKFIICIFIFYYSDPLSNMYNAILLNSYHTYNV